LTHIYLDASALVKRYRQESGSAVVNDTIERVTADNPRRLVVSSLSTVETLSILNRRRNEAGIPVDAFRRALLGVMQEIRTFSYALVMDDQLVLSSIQYAIKHNINSADAIHIAILLALQVALDASGDDLLCLAADKRLVRAARAEGITVVDPEDIQPPIL
jgi:predicted nucleic acid-binding protein